MHLFKLYLNSLPDPIGVECFFYFVVVVVVIIVVVVTVYTVVTILSLLSLAVDRLMLVLR